MKPAPNGAGFFLKKYEVPGNELLFLFLPKF